MYFIFLWARPYHLVVLSSRNYRIKILIICQRFLVRRRVRKKKSVSKNLTQNNTKVGLIRQNINCRLFISTSHQTLVYINIPKPTNMKKPPQLTKSWNIDSSHLISANCQREHQDSSGKLHTSREFSFFYKFVVYINW